MEKEDELLKQINVVLNNFSNYNKAIISNNGDILIKC